MRKWLLAALASVVLGGVALAQTPYYPGANIINLLKPFAIEVINGGPGIAVVPGSGGTFTCSSGSATVANTALDTNSVVIFGVKTPSGTLAAPYMATVTPGTGFTVTCGGSDASVWNYVILG